jgi:hypothetical protein
MKKCNCLRFFSLQAGRDDKSHYVFIADQGLIPIESLYPLEDFEEKTGKVIVVCPLYNFICNDRMISRAFDKLVEKQLSEEDGKLILEAVEKCISIVPMEKFLTFDERDADIIRKFCEARKVKMTYRLLKLFLKFKKIKGKYKDDTLCRDMVLPEEKQKCFDELWISAFGEYLKDVGFGVSTGH